MIRRYATPISNRYLADKAGVGYVTFYMRKPDSERYAICTSEAEIKSLKTHGYTMVLKEARVVDRERRLVSIKRINP